MSVPPVNHVKRYTDDVRVSKTLFCILQVQLGDGISNKKKIYTQVPRSPLLLNYRKRKLEKGNYLILISAYLAGVLVCLMTGR